MLARVASLARLEDDETLAIQAGMPVAVPDWLKMIGALRREHPGSLLHVGPARPGDQLDLFPIRFTTGDPVPNLVYTFAVAPELAWSASDEAALASLGRSAPLFGSEWIVDATPLPASDYGEAMFARLGATFAASNWNQEPRLVISAGNHQFTPTRWGGAVQRALTLPVRTPPEPILPDEPAGA